MRPWVSADVSWTWVRTIGLYLSLRRQTPTGLSFNDPGGIYFSQTHFYQFWPLYPLLSFPISSRWRPVRLPCKTETDYLQFVYLPGVLFVFNGRHCLHYVGCQKHYFEEHQFTLVDDDQCPSPRVTLHRSHLFPSPHQRYLSMMLSLFQRRMLLPHLAHGISLCDSSHSWRNFTPFSWSENKNLTNILVGKLSRSHCLAPEGSLWGGGYVFNFVLVSRDCYSKITHQLLLRCLYHTFGRRWTKKRTNHCNYTFEIVSVTARIGWGCTKPLSVVGTPLLIEQQYTLALFHGNQWKPAPICDSGSSNRVQIWRPRLTIKL
jgi:hypothetical protein